MESYRAFIAEDLVRVELLKRGLECLPAYQGKRGIDLYVTFEHAPGTHPFDTLEALSVQVKSTTISDHNCPVNNLDRNYHFLVIVVFGLDGSPSFYILHREEVEHIISHFSNDGFSVCELIDGVPRVLEALGAFKDRWSVILDVDPIRKLEKRRKAWLASKRGRVVLRDIPFGRSTRPAEVLRIPVRARTRKPPRMGT